MAAYVGGSEIGLRTAPRPCHRYSSMLDLGEAEGGGECLRWGGTGSVACRRSWRRGWQPDWGVDVVCTCLVYSLHMKVKGATSDQLQGKQQKFWHVSICETDIIWREYWSNGLQIGIFLSCLSGLSTRPAIFFSQNYFSLKQISTSHQPNEIHFYGQINSLSH
jgi:hypothetical protein